jgi:ABC-type dipeptide/oligopeptide/nickel transport system permease component/outer membrane protein assembly factor BamB
VAIAAAAVVLMLVPTGAAPGSHPDAAGASALADSFERFNSQGGWVTQGGSANRSGFTPLGGPLSAMTGSVYCPSTYPLRTGVVAVGALAFVADVFGDVYALNRSDLDAAGGNGTVVWHASVGSDPTTPDVSSDDLVIGDSDGGVTALDLETGAVAWTRSFGSPVLDGVAVVNGTVYFDLLDGTVAAVALDGGRTNWTATLPGPLTGSVAVADGRVFATSSDGNVTALNAATGTVSWNVSTGRPLSIGVGPAVYGDRVVVADNATGVTSFDATNGTEQWFWNGSRLERGDRIEAGPALTGSTVFVQTHDGNLYELNGTSGALEWNESNPQYVAGYPVYSTPAATPTVLYVYDATEQMKAISVATGRVLWRATFQSVSYAPVTVDSGEALIADETGCVRVVGRAASGTPWPVLGRVTDPNGTPLDGVSIFTGLTTNSTNASGGFFLTLPNGTYTLVFALSGYGEVDRPLTIDGPVTPFDVVLPVLPLYRLSGTVEDAYSGHGVGNVVVEVYGVDLFLSTVTSAPNGSFSVRVPAGPVELSAQPSDQHSNGAVQFTMPAGPYGGVVVSVPPTDLAIGPSDPYDLFVLLPLALLGAVGTTVWVGAARSRRVALGLPPAILSRFARYVLQRLILLPVQLLVMLTVLYLVGTFLPAAAQQAPVCSFSVGSCSYCPWSDPVCVSKAFGFGYQTFVWNLFTGNWGTATYGHLVEPALQLMVWYAPESIELAAFALTISAVAAYVLGLSAGWQRDRPVDTGVRAASVVGLLFPSFLVILVLFTLIYSPFLHFFGDTPFGVLPAPGWFEARGAVPKWIGIAYNTSPTGFPLIDAAWHGAWAAEAITLAKTLIQALLISAIYVPVYLRYARNAVAQAAEEPHVVAARARGIPESTIRWRHTGRRVVPIFLLAFAATLPLYVGTQSLVEAMTNDPGIGTLLLTQMSTFITSGFGFHSASGAAKPGNFYQVTIFLVVAVVLVGSLASEVLSRYLDPRAARAEPST